MGDYEIQRSKLFFRTFRNRTYIINMIEKNAYYMYKLIFLQKSTFKIFSGKFSDIFKASSLIFNFCLGIPCTINVYKLIFLS